MQRLKLVSLIGGAVSMAFILACGQAGQDNTETMSSSAADTASSNPSISTRNTSDPMARVFYDSSSGGYRLYVYTSSDLGSGSGTYPMNTTYVNSIGPGQSLGTTSNWTQTTVLTESQYPWVQSGTNHLWAPDAIERNGTYYLYVPDVQNKDGTKSHIGVSTSTSPIGPFTYQTQISISGYASDPGVMVDPVGVPYLVWANGDYNSSGISCGGISIAKLQQDMMTLDTSFTPHEIVIDGAPTSTSAPGCSGKGHLYLEGASLYYFMEGDGVPAGPDGPWYLIFAQKPDSGNEQIAYARATDPAGHFKYEGVIMDSSSTEWTNQASIVRWGGNWLFFYHDGPSGTPNRKVHAECFSFGSNGSIPSISRSQNGISSCTQYSDMLNVTIHGSGPAVVTDGGSNYCDTDTNPSCKWSYPNGSSVKLTATCQARPYRRVSWSGCDSVSGGACNVSMNGNKSVTYNCLRCVPYCDANGCSLQCEQ